MTKRVKLCFFVPFYPLVKGGAEYQSKILAKSLSKEKYEVFFISYSTNHTDSCSDIDGFRVYNVKIVPTKIEKITLYSRFFKEVERILKKENCDVIYQRVLNTMSYRVSSFSRKNKIPFVLHIADNYSIQFNGAKGGIKKLIFQRIVSNGTKLIVQTKSQKNTIKSIVKTHVIEQVPNMHPILFNQIGDKNRKRILWIGNSRPVKQLEVFIELSKKYSKSDLEFKVIGELPNNLYGKFLLNEMKAVSNIEFLGVRDNDYINKMLHRSALLVNTSKSEGFSNTFIQAWMAGTPVLSLNSNPNRLFDKNLLGYFCDGRNEELIQGLKEIIHSKLYLEMCEFCLRFANQNFGLETNAKKFERVLMNQTNHD